MRTQSTDHYLKLKRLVNFCRQAGGLVAGNEKLPAEIVLPHIWAIQIIPCLQC